MRPPKPTTADLGRLLGLRVGGAELKASDPRRGDYLKALRAGEALDGFAVDVLAYAQTDQPNRNFVRFTPRALQRMAPSFVGAPFLRDHESMKLEARGGTITAAKLEGSAGDPGGHRLHLTLEVVKPWAQLGVLDGTISTFSIGWAPNLSAEPLCTVCDLPMFRFDSGCNHWPGDTATLKGGVERTVEMLYTDADGVEVSAVNVPAVPGTGIEGVRAALAAWRADEGSAPERKKTMRNLATELGLSEDANEAACLEIIRAQKTAQQALVASHRQTAEALTTAQARLAQIETEQGQTKLTALIESAYREGKIAATLGADGKRTPNDLERAIRGLAAQSFAGAEAFVAQMPRIVPTGALDARRTPPREDRNPDALTSEEKARAKKLGVSEESYLKAKADVYGKADNDKDEE